MLISRYGLGTGPDFTISRTDEGVSLELSYDLSGTPGEEEDSWTWDGSLDARLGDDKASTSQTTDQTMKVGFEADLKDGVTEVGRYVISDGGEDGGSITVEFDVTSFSTAATYVGEGMRSHFVFGSAEADKLTGADGADVLSGLNGDDTLDGGKGDDRLYGGDGADSITGGDGLDTVRGGLGDDKVSGGDGDDKVVGGEGADALTGGAGADSFVFKDITGAEDEILDFKSGEDRILLDAKAFTALENGALEEGAFVANETGAATEEDQRLIYDTVKGELYYDADGSGDGGAVLIATLGPDVALTADDIAIFGGV